MSIDRYEKYSGGLKQFLKQPNECIFPKKSTTCGYFIDVTFKAAIILENPNAVSLSSSLER